MPVGIRKYWPTVTNDQINKLNELDCRQWYLISRMGAGKRIGGNEISEGDLLQSVSSDKKVN